MCIFCIASDAIYTNTNTNTNTITITINIKYIYKNKGVWEFKKKPLKTRTFPQIVENNVHTPVERVCTNCLLIVCREVLVERSGFRNGRDVQVFIRRVD